MKKLGQHFLKNQSAIKKIVASLDLKSGDTIIEIGAGHGELTRPIIEICRKLGCKVVAVEKDPELAAQIQNFSPETDHPLDEGSSKNLEIITGDIRKILPKLIPHYSLQTTHYKLVGNIPYYITGRLLRNISELKNKPELCVLTLQKEVALRICAVPPRMNRLAAAVQFWAEPKIIGFISKRDFSPTPEVDSAIIKLGVRLEVFPPRRGEISPSAEGSRDKKQTLNEENYYKAVKILFQQPRKTIRNNLSVGLKKSRADIETKLRFLGVEPSSRPQNLSVEKIKKIASLL